MDGRSVRVRCSVVSEALGLVSSVSACFKGGLAAPVVVFAEGYTRAGATTPKDLAGYAVIVKAASRVSPAPGKYDLAFSRVSVLVEGGVDGLFESEKTSKVFVVVIPSLW